LLRAFHLSTGHDGLASAATFAQRQARRANGARIRLKPQKDWEVNQRPNSPRFFTLWSDPEGFQRRTIWWKEGLAGDLIVLAARSRRVAAKKAPRR